MMLYYHLRNLQCLLRAIFRPRIPDPTAVFTKTFFANPFDSDWMQVIQAGQFLTYTDAVRWEMAIRAGFLKALFREQWVIIMGGQKLLYRKPIRLFRRFTITFQITGWDDKWMYAGHVFRQNGETKCVVFSKIGLRKRGKLLNPNEAFKWLGYKDLKAPPAWILKHFENDLDSIRECADALKVELPRQS